MNYVKLNMGPKIRISRVQVHHNLPQIKNKIKIDLKIKLAQKKRNTRKNKLHKQSTKNQQSIEVPRKVTTNQREKVESAYATPAQKYWRPLESRTPAYLIKLIKKNNS